MLRRKLALYTLLYIAGITAGFFMLERARALEASGFTAAVIAMVVFADLPDTAHYSFRRETRNQTDHSDKHLNIGKEAIRTQKTILAIMFLAGFLGFALRMLSYDAALSYLHDQDYIKGRVTSVTVKDDKLRLIIRNRDAGPAKVLVTLDEDAVDRSVQQDGESTSGENARSAVNGYIGATVEARGEFAELSSADNPGCFDYGLYMKSNGVTARFKAYILEVCDSRVSPSARIKRCLYDIRESFISRFYEETQGFIRGVIFGDKSEIDEDILEEFNNNSTGHILAVSGLHVGFLYGLLRFMTARRRTLPVSILIIAVILLYGEMTMWSAATVRACIVMTVTLCSVHLRRRSDLLTSISLAAFLILTYQPYQLFNSGFQLSFLALCGIAFLSAPISTVTGETLAVMLAVQIGTMPVIAYSYCRINPLSILINIPVILLASVLVPVCILMLILEAAAGRVPAAGIDLAELISYAVVKINHILSFGGDFSINTAGPGAAAIIMVYAAAFGLASEWTRVMLLRKQLRSILKLGILMLMPLVMLFSCLYDTISDDEIVFVAVGQGDCIHVRAEGHDVLIDGGGQVSTGSGQHGGNYNSKESKESETNKYKRNMEKSKGINNDSKYDKGQIDKDKTENEKVNKEKDKNEKNTENSGYNVGKNILMPYLMHGSADAVDIALVTHLHADHYKGIEELSEIFPVGAIGVPADYKASFSDIMRKPYNRDKSDPSGSKESDSAANYGIDYKNEKIPKLELKNQITNIIYVNPSEQIIITDDVYIEPIWPVKISKEQIAVDDPNEHNTVYMIHYKGIKVMVTGDLLEEDEKEMVRYYQGTDTLKCDILKVAHHGSKSNSSEVFLDAAKPRIAVIQCGRNNFYGHPHKQTLERLEERGIKVLRTDISGAVGIDIHGSRLSVDLFK